MKQPRFIRNITISVSLLASLLLLTQPSLASDIQPTGPKLEPKKGRFLVATDNLANSSFRETVIFVTHYSTLGATGITINRPANIPINEAFPTIKELSKISDTLFLGGPVKTDGIFVLMKTKRPHAGMKNVTDDIYFTVGLNAVIHGIPNAVEGEATRAYAGYAGWAPGQLQTEIERGDWIIAESDTSIIFDNNIEALWPTLYKIWSGNWI
jgi:putative transcriptional regulator